MVRRPRSSLALRTIIIVMFVFCSGHLENTVVEGGGIGTTTPPPWKSFLCRLRPRHDHLTDRTDPHHKHPSRATVKSTTKTTANANDVEQRIFEQQRKSHSTTNKGGEESVELRREYGSSTRQRGARRRGIRPQQLWNIFWANLPPRFHDTRQWGRWMASGVQIGCIVYLAHAIWKTIGEVLDEYYAAAEDGEGQHGMDPPIFTRDHVQHALEQLSNTNSNPYHASAVSSSWRASGGASSNFGSNDHRSMAALAIAQRLLLIGLPLRNGKSNSRNGAASGRAGATANSNDAHHARSIENILSTLNRQEANLLQECLWLPPRRDELSSSSSSSSSSSLWERIYGLDRVKRGLMSALATVQRRTPHAYATLFDNASAGVLLYGPPGCGKTMLAMALSGVSRIPCLLITPSVLLRKYVGETNQQCRTLFSLASKLSPCIICIDELDGLFRKRSENEHEVSRDLKTEFLQNWEGMLSRPSRNLVIAATNRPFDVDEAVLRRFTQSHLVGLPDVTTRTRLLRSLLQDVPTAPDVDTQQLAAQTEGYSPSDLRRLLQTAAAMGPLRESFSQPRPLTRDDIQQAIHSVPSTPLSHEYRHALTHFIRSNQGAITAPASHDHHSYEGGYNDKWETEWGNFYHLGSLQVDAPTFALLSSIMERLNDMAEEWSDLDEDDESHYHDEDKDK